MAFLFVSIQLNAQNTFKVYLKDATTKEPLTGATAVVAGTTNGASADVNGLLEIKNIADGRQIVTFTFIGYQTLNDTFNFPFSAPQL